MFFTLKISSHISQNKHSSIRVGKSTHALFGIANFALQKHRATTFIVTLLFSNWNNYLPRRTGWNQQCEASEWEWTKCFTTNDTLNSTDPRCTKKKEREKILLPWAAALSGRKTQVAASTPREKDWPPSAEVTTASQQSQAERAR